MPNMPALHLIEPTLYNLAGHGYSYVSQVARRAIGEEFETHVWIDKRGSNLFKGEPIITHPWFSRKFRQIQKVQLYYKLVKSSDIIYVCTSELWDLKVLSFMSRWLNPQAKIICHFHQFKVTTKKILSIKEIALISPNISIFAPTDRLIKTFLHSGFKTAIPIPCPSYPPRPNILNSNNSSPYVIFAGAARSDKGFDKVIETIRYCQKNKLDYKFKIQASKPNSNRYDHETQKAMSSLDSLSKNNRLTIINSTLSQKEYQDLFNNNISLLLYDQNLYEDKFSGVMLDAIYACSPIITSKNTWMGDIIEKYNVGITLDSFSPEQVSGAIKTIKDNYKHYQNRCNVAAGLLAKEHDPINTIIGIRKAIS